MARKPSKKTLKNKAWKYFSEYIRRKYSDDNGYCRCVTCGKVDHWKSMQAGHAVGGRTNSLIFLEEIVHPQCVHCNIFLRGNYNRYALFMIDKYGREKFEEFLNLKHQVAKLSIHDLVDICEKYRKLIEEME